MATMSGPPAPPARLALRGGADVMGQGGHVAHWGGHAPRPARPAAPAATRTEHAWDIGE